MRGIVIDCVSGPVVNFGGRHLVLDKYKFLEHDACREQYPLKLAYGMTVHGAQGQTMDCVIIDCTDFFMAGQLGVAVGRAKNTKNLQVINYTSTIATFTPDARITEFMNYMFQCPTPVSATCCQESVCPAAEELVHPTVQETNDAVTTNTPSVSFTTIQQPEYINVLLGNLRSDMNLAEGEIVDEFNNLYKCGNLAAFLEGCSLFMDAKVQEMKSAGTASEKRKSQMATGIFKDVHSYLISETFAQLCITLYRGHPTRIQRKFCSKLAFSYFEDKITLTAEEGREQAKPESKPVEELPAVLPSALQAKIRYIAGATVAKLRHKHNELTKMKLYKCKTTTMTEDRIKRLLFAELRISEAIITEESCNQESLSETQSRQGISRGLTNVTDSVFHLFLQLYRMLYSLSDLNVDFARGNISVGHLASIAYSDGELFETWFALFKSLSHVSSEDEELHISLQIAIFEETVFHFTKIWCSELLCHKKSELTMKRQALRSDLKAQKQKDGKSAGKPECSKGKASPEPQVPESEPEIECEESEVYNCGACGGVCLDNPDQPQDESICCDRCNTWHHYKCVGITGKESFLSQTSSKWFCERCKRLNAQKMKRKRTRSTDKK